MNVTNYHLSRMATKYNSLDVFYKMEKSYQTVLQIIADGLNIKPEYILIPSRKREVVDGRQLFSKWLKEATTLTLKNIGSIVRVTQQDHSTVKHSIATINDLIHTDKNIRFIWDAIKDIEIEKTLPTIYQKSKKIVTQYEETIYPKTIAFGQQPNV